VHNGAAERKGDTGMSIVAVDEGGQGLAMESAPRGDEASTATDFPGSRRCQPQTSQHAQKLHSGNHCNQPASKLFAC
jgi:hypothetical protein